MGEGPCLGTAIERNSGRTPAMRRQDVTSSVTASDSRLAPRGGDSGPSGAAAAGAEATPGRRSVAPEQPPDSPRGPPEAPASPSPRWLVVLAWSTGPAALYTLLSLAHAAVVERILSVDVGFGRSLAFWVGSI